MAFRGGLATVRRRPGRRPRRWTGSEPSPIDGRTTVPIPVTPSPPELWSETVDDVGDCGRKVALTRAGVPRERAAMVDIRRLAS